MSRAISERREREVVDQVDGLFSWATDLLRDLVAEPSVTGSEQGAQAIVTAVLRDLNLAVDEWCPRRDELATHPSFSDDGLPLGDRPVVVGAWTISSERPTLTLNGHVDVVPTGDAATWTHGPWSGHVVDGRLYGRGACDMKGGLVAALLAVNALRSAGIEPAVNVLVQSVIGEESGGAGTLAAIVRGHAGDAAVILEPTGLALCPVGAGAATFRLRVRGRAAHGALREQGVSAIDRFIDIAAALRALERRRHEDFRHPAFADGAFVAPISIGTVRAGDWPSTVPDLLVAEGRYGVLPGESLSNARRILEGCVRDAADDIDVEWFEGQFEPAATDIDAPLVSMVARAHADVVGSTPAVRGVPYGSDLRFFTNDAGVPAVLYGPGDISLAHGVDEYVELDEVRAAAKVIALLLLREPPRRAYAALS